MWKFLDFHTEVVLKMFYRQKRIIFSWFQNVLCPYMRDNFPSNANVHLCQSCITFLEAQLKVRGRLSEGRGRGCFVDFTCFMLHDEFNLAFAISVGKLRTSFIFIPEFWDSLTDMTIFGQMVKFYDFEVVTLASFCFVVLCFSVKSVFLVDFETCSVHTCMTNATTF